VPRLAAPPQQGALCKYTSHRSPGRMSTSSESPRGLRSQSIGTPVSAPQAQKLHASLCNRIGPEGKEQQESGYLAPNFFSCFLTFSGAIADLNIVIMKLGMILW